EPAMFSPAQARFSLRGLVESLLLVSSSNPSIRVSSRPMAWLSIVASMGALACGGGSANDDCVGAACAPGAVPGTQAETPVPAPVDMAPPGGANSSSEAPSPD